MSRRGSSYLEIQVAMVLLSIGMMGLYSISVVHTKQSVRLRNVLPPDQVASINPMVAGNPQETAWLKKLGAVAAIESDAVATTTTLYPLNLGFEQTVDDEDGPSAFQIHTAPGAIWFEYGGLPNHNESLHLLYSGSTIGSYAEYTIAITPGEYEVLMFVPRHSLFGDSVPYEIYDGNTLVDTVFVDQHTPSVDHFQWGKWWERLGVYTFNDPTLRVRVLDTSPSGIYLVTDAVMVRCRRSFDLLTDVMETEDGGARVTVEMN